MANKVYWIYIFIIGCFLSACTQETSIIPSDTNTVIFDISTGTTISRAGGAPDQRPAGYDTRYIIEVWNSDNSALLMDRITQMNKTTFTIVIGKEVAYNIAVWVDYVEQGTTDDNFYSTESLKGVHMNLPSHEYGQNPSGSPRYWYDTSDIGILDAFTGCFPFAAGSTPSGALIVKRPFARVDIVGSDAGQWKNLSKAKNGSSGYYNLDFSNEGWDFYQEFDVLTQKAQKRSVSEGPDNLWLKHLNTLEPGNETKPGYSSFADVHSECVISGLYFANNSTTTISFYLSGKIMAPTVSKVEHFDIYVPIQRNCVTTVTGSIFFGETTFSIDVEDAYGGIYTQSW